MSERNGLSAVSELVKRLAQAQREADAILDSHREKREDNARAQVLLFAERFVDPLSERERKLVAAMRTALWLSDAIDLYLQLHPRKPEERLGDREAALEVEGFDLDEDDFNAIMAERYPTLPLPLLPTLAEPGTERKIEDMAARYARGEHIHSPDDLGRDPCDEIGRDVSRGPNGRARAGELRLTKGDAA